MDAVDEVVGVEVGELEGEGGAARVDGSVRGRLHVHQLGRPHRQGSEVVAEADGGDDAVSGSLALGTGTGTRSGMVRLGSGDASIIAGEVSIDAGASNSAKGAAVSITAGASPAKGGAVVISSGSSPSQTGDVLIHTPSSRGDTGNIVGTAGTSASS